MDSVVIALAELIEPFRLLMLFSGVMIGLVIGVVPGLGGIFGLTLLVPLTFGMDPYAAFALLLGMSSVLTTSDTIPAVLIGVPGTVGAMATVLDGHPLAKLGQAARALSAAYTSSMIGGLFGAILLAASIPIMRPMVLALNFGDLLAITIFGLTLVAILSGSSPLKGLIAAVLGVLASYIGLDPQDGVERWTFDLLYLWEGLPIAVIFLGLFGLPELASLLTRGQAQNLAIKPEPGGLRRGVGDALHNWRLVLSSSAIGSFLGAVPGIGVAVIDWIAYGRAANKPGDGPPFGQGNIRGVIAPESANNAKEGGALIPTVALGIPGSAGMAILLGAFTVQGLTPGPGMLTEHTPLLLAMVFSIALANIIGAGLCLGFTPQLAKIAVIPGRVLVPLVVVFIALGAFQSNTDILDFVFLIGFGALGITMKNLEWPRAAFALGFVLGPNLERFSFLTMQLYGWSWLIQPVVIALLAISAFALVRREIARRRRRDIRPAQPYPWANVVFAMGLVAAAGYMLVTATQFTRDAAIFPTVTAALLLALTVGYLGTTTLGATGRADLARKATDSILATELRFLLAPVLMALLILAFGHLVASAAFILICGLWYRADRLRWLVVRAALVTLTVYAVFDLLVSQPWPKPWLWGL